MTIPNTTQVIVDCTFQDSFTGPAVRAFEQFKTNAEAAFQAVASAGVRAFSQIQEAQASVLKSSGQAAKEAESRFRENLPEIQTGIYGFQAILALITALAVPVDNLKANLKSLETGFIRLVSGPLASVTRGFEELTAVLTVAGSPLVGLILAVATFFAAWEAGKALAEVTVGGKPVKEYFQDAFEFWLTGGLTAKLKGSFDGLTLMFKDSFNALGNSMRQWGADVVDQFVNGLAERWERLKSSAGNLIPDGLRKFLRQQSPAELGVLDSEAWGARVPELFADGMLQTVSRVGDAANAMVGEIQGPVAQAGASGELQGPIFEQQARIGNAAGAIDKPRRAFDESAEAARRLTGATRDLSFAIGTAFEDAVIKGRGFGSVLQGLEQDMIRIAMRTMVTKPLEGLIGGFLGGLDLPIPGFAQGGSVFADRTILVGENGPELFRPRSDGSIVPNDRIGSNITVHMNIQTPDVAGFVQNRGAILTQMNQAVARGARNA